MPSFCVRAMATVPVEFIVDAENRSGARRRAYKIARQMWWHAPGLLAAPAGGAWIKWPRVDGIAWGDTTLYDPETTFYDPDQERGQD